MDQIGVPHYTGVTRSEFVRGLLLAGLLPAIGAGPAQAAPSELEKRERSAYDIWHQEFRHFENLQNGVPRAVDDPRVPFDVARMYGESDVVLECALGNYISAAANLRLVVRIADIGGVYKGQIPVTALEPEKANLHLCVMHDELGTHDSFVRLQSSGKSRYLLFLKKVPDDERQLRGYGDLKATLFKVYRVWQGAIRLDGTTYLNGDANYQLFRDERFRKLPLSVPDILDAVKLLSASGAASEGAMNRVAWESRYLKALIPEANGAIRETVPDEFKNLPADVLETFTAEILRSRYATCKDPEKRLALSARLRFRAIMWKDLAALPPE